MGANNWAACPRCLKHAQDRRAEMESAATAAYGSVSVEEFDRMREEAADISLDPDTYTTFREDWELGVHRGEFFVNYVGACDHCGLMVRFTHKESVAI